MAGIDQIARCERGKGAGVPCAICALPDGLFGEGHAEPLEILDDLPFEDICGASGIQVFDAQQEAPAGARGHLLVQQGGVCVTQMEPPVGRRRETKYCLSGAVHGWKSKRNPGDKVAKRRRHNRHCRQKAHAPQDAATQAAGASAA